MRLKILTTSSLICGVLMLFSWPFLLGPRPPRGAPKLEIARYAERYLVLFGLTAIVFVLTAFFAWLMIRQERLRFLDRTRENLGELVEGTLKDHAREHE